jgi:hypothetical protein
LKDEYFLPLIYLTLASTFMKTKIILILLCFCSIAASAQHYCGSYEAYQEQMKNNLAFRLKQELSKQRNSSSVPYEGIVTIPVVVHILYHTDEQNISDEQIYSQLEVLNEDFGSVISAPAMWHEVAANPQMRFCLATRDISGNATCGITRTYTDSVDFVIQTSIKDESTGGISGWPATDYLNIFVGNIRNVRGYATFPDAEDSIDGIVVDYLSFGRGMEFNLVPRYDQGRTATHEVGHWLRLSHVWGDGGCDIDDGIGDTPSAAGPNYGCNVGSLACRGDSLNMVQNYMDYSDDACMNLFTQQQVELMRKAFDVRGSRVSILSSQGCMAPAQNQIDFTINFDEFPQDISWELRNSSDSIVASDGNFDPGDEILGIPAPLANKSKVYRLDFPDGNYTLTIFDSFGDGFPAGDYKISTVHNEVIIQGTGDFASQLSRSFTLNDFKYRFVGGSAIGSIVDWYNPTNWNRRSSPSDCYEGDIIIESDCVKNDGLEINLPNEFTVKDGVQFSVNN